MRFASPVDIPAIRGAFYSCLPILGQFKGHLKWVDFFMHYWHRDCVCKLSLAAFTESYRCWCRRKKYRFRSEMAQKVYELAKKCVSTLPKCESTKILIMQACKSLNAICEAKQASQLQAEPEQVFPHSARRSAGAGRLFDMVHWSVAESALCFLNSPHAWSVPGPAACPAACPVA